MRNHNLLRDVEAKARILTEGIFTRAIRIKPVENLAEIIGRNSWPLIFNDNLDLSTDTTDGYRNRAAFGRERDGIIQQICDDLPQTDVVPENDVPVLVARRTFGNLHDNFWHLRAARLAESWNDRLKHLRDVNRLRILPGQFGIKSRRIGNVSYQAVKPTYIIVDDLDKTLMRFLRLNAGKCLRGTA